MKYTFLEQGTEQWLAWREEGLTATESAVVLGLSPYKTPWRLWAEKTHYLRVLDISDDPFVRYGREHEPIARRAYEVQTNDELLVVCGEYEEDPRFRASFDGIDKDGAPVEFKCPCRIIFNDVKAKKTESDAFKLYYIQVQHQIMVADADHGHLVFFNGENGEMVVFRIQRDKRLIRRILREGDLFCEKVRRRSPPPKDPKRDLVIPSGKSSAQWMKAASEILIASQKIRECELRIEELRTKIAPARETIDKLMGDCANADYGGLIVSRSLPSGRVDYAKMVHDLLGRDPTEAELALYRPAPIEKLRIRPSKKGESLILDEEVQTEMQENTPDPIQGLWL